MMLKLWPRLFGSETKSNIKGILCKPGSKVIAPDMHEQLFMSHHDYKST
jgi:hypothetical protein